MTRPGPVREPVVRTWTPATWTTRAALRPAAGMALAWVAARLIALPPREEALLLVFGALPPAVLNYMLAERYGQEPDKVASMVLIGNLATVVFMPLALAVALGVALPP